MFKYKVFSEHIDTLAFAVPNNGQKRPALKSQAQNLSFSQRPISISLNSIKSRSKANKVSLEELAIDTESNSNIQGGMATTSILNSPPPLTKNNKSKTESELSRLEKELQQIIDIQSNVFQRRNSIYEQLAEVRIIIWNICDVSPNLIILNYRTLVK